MWAEWLEVGMWVGVGERAWFVVGFELVGFRDYWGRATVVETRRLIESGGHREENVQRRKRKPARVKHKSRGRNGGLA